MYRIGGGILVVVLALSVAADADERRDQPPTPAEQYQALLKEYRAAADAFSKAAAAVKTDEERKKLVRPWDKFAPRFLELAENNPKNPIAVDALVWVVDNTADGAEGKDSPRAKAVGHLLRDHIRSDKLGPVCPRLAGGFAKESETFLRTVLMMNPHMDVQGLACLALAQFLNNRLRLLDRIKDGPELAKEYEALLGKDYFNELVRQDRAQAVKEVEARFEQAAEKYGDVKGPFPWTVGVKAKAELFEIRHLSVGKEAPEIEGEDQGGKKFKLSDYRGKVVLLDFWRES
jgi:hypothetical protein